MWRCIADAAPGVLLCTAGTAVAMGLNRLWPLAPTMLVAIVLGAVLTNTVTLPAQYADGVAVAAKHFLRLGVVLLGIQIAVPEILGLGYGAIVTVVAVIFCGVGGTIVMGWLLRIDQHLTLLIAAGFSVCGAAAVGGVQPVVRAAREKDAAALALVVVFGSAAMVVVPGLAGLIGFDERRAGAWAGASIHEVA